MPAISFSVFKDKILDGSKTQTIRKIRKRPIKLGDTLQLYWQQRTPNRELLLESKCIAISTVEIHDDCFIIDDDIPTKGSARFCAYSRMMRDFAIADGFNDWEEMLNWLEKTHGLPFSGVLIKWEAINHD